MTYHELIKREANAHPASGHGSQGECDGISTDWIYHIVLTIWCGSTSKAQVCKYKHKDQLDQCVHVYQMSPSMYLVMYPMISYLNGCINAIRLIEGQG